jgi:Flp pilus assembly protein TadG
MSYKTSVSAQDGSQSVCLDKKARRRSDRGAALVEAAIMIPILLLITAGIFDIGRAYQTWQVLSNAAREGARMAVLPNANTGTVQALVRTYMTNGQLGGSATAAVSVTPVTLTVNGVNVQASQVIVDYPYDFIMLGPVARMVAPSSTAGGHITMRATAVMRNEM